MTSSSPARRFDWRNLALRALSALVMAPVVVAAVWYGGWAFLVLVAVAVALLTIEWGEMSDPDAPIRAAMIMAAAVLAAVFATFEGYPKVGLTLALLGAAAGALIALVRGRIDRPADIAFGVLYVGAPCVALMWLRSGDSGRGWTLTLLALTWAADIAAFAVGNLVKGPKLWPRFSPNKTWSGFIGGLLAAMLAAGAIAAFLPDAGRPSVAAAAWVGLAGGLATMGGDLLESMLKRRFGVKDSGSLIPGHGGLLDRVDGLMLAAVVLAAMRLIGAFEAGV